MVIHSIFESNRFIVINYFFKKGYLLFFDRHRKETFLIQLEYDDKGNCLNGIRNDIDDGPLFMPLGYYSENGREYMFGLTDPLKIKNQIRNNRYKNANSKSEERTTEVERLSSSLKETDNPVFMIVRLTK